MHVGNRAYEEAVAALTLWPHHQNHSVHVRVLECAVWETEEFDAPMLQAPSAVYEALMHSSHPTSGSAEASQGHLDREGVRWQWM